MHNSDLPEDKPAQHKTALLPLRKKHKTENEPCHVNDNKLVSHLFMFSTILLFPWGQSFQNVPL